MTAADGWNMAKRPEHDAATAQDPAAARRGPRGGNVLLLLALAGGLVGAAIALSLLASEKAQPLIIGLLALLFIVCGGPCSVVWVAFGTGMRQWLQDPVRLRVFNITMAVALVGSMVPMLTTPAAT